MNLIKEEKVENLNREIFKDEEMDWNRCGQWVRAGNKGVYEDLNKGLDEFCNDFEENMDKGCGIFGQRYFY